MKCCPFFFLFLLHIVTRPDKLPYYQKSIIKKTKNSPTHIGFYFVAFSSKKPNNNGNKPKAAPMRPVGMPATFESAGLLQDSDDVLNMKTFTIVDKTASERMKNTISSTRTVKLSSLSSITNPSKNTDLLPSDVIQESHKIPAICLLINS